jgi:hypothetical protein
VFNVTLKKIIVSKPKGPTILVELSEFSIFQGKFIQQLPRTHHISRKTILYLSSRSRISTVVLLMAETAVPEDWNSLTLYHRLIKWPQTVLYLFVRRIVSYEPGGRTRQFISVIQSTTRHERKSNTHFSTL